MFCGFRPFVNQTCISEAQRYEGKLKMAPKQKVKRNPQEIWTHVVEEAVEDAANAPAALRSFVGGLNGYGNVPRNEKKFGSFVKNSLNVWSDATIKALWDYLAVRQKKAQDDQAADIAEAAASSAAAAAAAATPGNAAGDVGGDGVAGEKRSLEAGDDTAAAAGETKEAKKAKKSKKAKAGKAEAGGDDDDGVSAAADGACAAGAAVVDVVAWGKAVTRALKGAPGRSMEAKALRKAAAKEVGSSLGKAEVRADVKAALAALPKATEADGTVTYAMRRKEQCSDTGFGGIVVC